MQPKITPDQTNVNVFLPSERSNYEIHCDKCLFIAILNVDDIEAAESVRDTHSDGNPGHRAYLYRNTTHALVSTSMNRGLLAEARR